MAGTNLLQTSEKVEDLLQCMQFWLDRIQIEWSVNQYSEISLNLVIMRKSRQFNAKE